MRREVVLTPAEMAAADRHAIAAGTPGSGARRAGRARGRAPRAAHARRHVRPPGRGRVRQGQQRRRRAGRGAAAARARESASTSCSLEDGFDERRAAARARPRRPRDRRDVRHRLPRRARRRGRDGRATCSTRRACRCSRSTSRRASTARPARSRARRCARDETICFAAYKPGLAVRAGPHARGPRRGRRHRHRRRRRPVPRSSVLDVDRSRAARAAAPTSHKWSSGCLVVGGSSGMVGAPLLAGRAALRCGAGMVVCAVPGPRRPRRRCRAASSSRARCPRPPTARSTRTRPTRC